MGEVKYDPNKHFLGDRFFGYKKEEDGNDLYRFNFVNKVSDSGIKDLDKHDVWDVDCFDDNIYTNNMFGRIMRWMRKSSFLAVPLALIISVFMTNVDSKDAFGLGFAAFLCMLGVFGCLELVNSRQGFQGEKANEHFAYVEICSSPRTSRAGLFSFKSEPKMMFSFSDLELACLLHKLTGKERDKVGEYVDTDDLATVREIYNDVMRIARIRHAQTLSKRHTNPLVRAEMEEYLNGTDEEYQQLRDELIAKIESEIEYIDNHQLEEQKNEIKEVLYG